MYKNLTSSWEVYCCHAIRYTSLHICLIILQYMLAEVELLDQRGVAARKAISIYTSASGM